MIAKAASLSSRQNERITNCLRVIRNAWHFYYALISVFKVLCGGFGIACSHLNRALVGQDE
ncbi:DUF3265 domain-containing protein [Vibrio sp. 11-4(1)]|nr:DUF3265 domain-containing protein [Vibrio sp. 11-4(1)]NNN82280.1 DUF3265 domain-containing protein [Vibrio sp. 11-4(1)]